MHATRNIAWTVLQVLLNTAGRTATIAPNGRGLDAAESPGGNEKRPRLNQKMAWPGIKSPTSIALVFSGSRDFPQHGSASREHTNERAGAGSGRVGVRRIRSAIALFAAPIRAVHHREGRKICQIPSRTAEMFITWTAKLHKLKPGGGPSSFRLPIYVVKIIGS